MLKEIFKYQKVSDTFFRPLGAGFSILFPLVLGLIIHNMEMAQFSVLGAFSFLAFQRKSIFYNLKATTLHGVALLGSFSLGILVSKSIFLLPFVIALLSIIGFFIVKIYNIPKPAHFFVIMLFATGTNTHLLSLEFINIMIYVSIGVCSGIINSVIVSFFLKLPWKTPKSKFQNLSFKDKYYVVVYNKPKIWIDAIHFSFILFIAGYLSYLLRAEFGYWVLISSAAVLSGEEIEVIKHRYKGRVVGSIIGIIIGILLLSLNLSIPEIIIVLLVLNIAIEYFMPRNYTIANFFTNPLVMLLGGLTSVVDPTFIVLTRLNGAILGSLIAGVLISIMHYALKINNMEY